MGQLLRANREHEQEKSNFEEQVASEKAHLHHAQEELASKTAQLQHADEELVSKTAQLQQTDLVLASKTAQLQHAEKECEKQKRGMFIAAVVAVVFAVLLV